MTENEIQRDILNYLELRGIPATRNHAGRVRVGKHWINLGKKGWPDIISALPPKGRFLGIEVKKPGEKLSEAQEERKAELERAGGLVIVATCIEDVIKELDNEK